MTAIHAPGRLRGIVRCLCIPLVLLCLAVETLCAEPDSGQPSERVFNVTGVVASHLKDGTLRIAHDDIPGFMPAMTMPFYVEDETEAAKLQPGDMVEFKFTVGERSRASGFKVLRPATQPPTPDPGAQPLARAGAGQKRLKTGEVLMPVPLTTQDGSPLAPRYFEEGYTVLTFIFTRCPVPEFCPLIMKRLQELGKRLESEPELGSQTRFLVVTIDPEHDTPQVLRQYGESYGVDFSRWTFVTGDPAVVRALEKAFAVRVEQNSGSLDHSLATAVLAPGGRVIEVLRGNGWKTAEVIDALKAATP